MNSLKMSRMDKIRQKIDLLTQLAEGEPKN